MFLIHRLMHPWTNQYLAVFNPWNNHYTVSCRWDCIKHLVVWVMLWPSTQSLHSCCWCDLPCVQTRSRSPGTVWRILIYFTTDCPHYPWMPPLSGDNNGWSGFGCAFIGHAHIWWKQLWDINYKPKVALPSKFCPRTQHLWWDHREKSQWASTLRYCRGKSRLVGLSPVNGT